MEWQGLFFYFAIPISVPLPIPYDYDVCMQMQRRVQKLTDSFLNAGDGDTKFTAQIFANFASQRAVKPFVPILMGDTQQRFGDNVLKTLRAAKRSSTKPGCPADLMRRQLISAGARGDKIGATNPVWHFATCLYVHEMLY